VILADEHGVVLEGMRLLLTRSMKYEIAGMAASGEEAVAMACYLKPKVVVLDAMLPGLDGAEVIARIKAEDENIGVVAVSVRGDGVSMCAILSAGADAYVLKESLFQELEIAIDQVAQGGFFLGAGLDARSRGIGAPGSVRRPPAGPCAFPLSFRELDVLDLILQGYDRETITRRLGLDRHGVNAYLKRIERKTGIKNAAELLGFAMSLRESNERFG
jgi:DNA-binding NarL/FixJ family response regulator